MTLPQPLRQPGYTAVCLCVGSFWIATAFEVVVALQAAAAAYTAAVVATGCSLVTVKAGGAAIVYCIMNVMWI